MHVLLSMAAFATAFATAAVRLAAQTPAPVPDVVETITPQDVARHIAVIADDSMRGRDTPSRGLELTARYIADQFQALGLKPGGEQGGWFQRYPPAGFDWARSRVVFAAGGKTAVTDLATAAFLARPVVPARPRPLGVVLVAGVRLAKLLEPWKLGDKIVLYLPPAGPRVAEDSAVMKRLLTTSQGVVVLSDQEAADFALAAQFARYRSEEPGSGPGWEVHVRPEGVASLTEVLAAGGVDLARARRDTTPVVQDIPAIQVSLELQGYPTASDSAIAPNVVGLLEGRDPKLKHEYVIFSASMDDAGTGQSPADRVHGSADDNASGVAGLIALANAFRQPGAQPARSLLFLATSGGAKGFWGSEFFAARLSSARAAKELLEALGEREAWRLVVTGRHATIDRGNTLASTALAIGGNASYRLVVRADTSPEATVIARPIAQVNLDGIGRSAGDSVVIDGLTDLESAMPLRWVIAAHPELRLTAVDGGTAFRPAADLFILRLGVPSLYVHSGTDGRSPRPDSSLARDIDQAARITRLVFYVGQEIANGQRAPQWTAEAWQRSLDIAERRSMVTP